jgi:hypothetical protein
VIPVALKPAPVTFICEIVRSAAPVLLTFTDCVVVVPVLTFPNARELGLVVNVP